MGESSVKDDFMLTPVGQQQKLFEIQQRKAQMYSTSTIVPDVYKNNVGNCYIAVDMATRMRANELVVMQNLDIIKGKPCFSAKFLIGVINMMGNFSKMKFRTEKKGTIGKIQYKDLQWDNIAKKNKQVISEFDGTAIEDMVCIAYATDLESGDLLESEPVSINGTEVSSMVYNTADNTLSVGDMHVTSNIDAADWFINDFKTYVIIPGENRGDAEESLMSEIKTAADKGWGKWEISDRDNRPLICTGRTWVCFYGSAQAKPEDIRTDEKDKIKFPLYETDGIRGFSSKDEAAIAEVEGLAPNLLDVFFDSEWYVILEGEKNADNSQLYLISPDTDKWFKADRDM